MGGFRFLVQIHEPDPLAQFNGTPPLGWPLLYNVSVPGRNITFTCGSEAPVPRHLLFRMEHVVKITLTSLIFVLSVLGNVTLFVVLASNLRRRSDRVQRLLLHMNIADLIVTLYHLPKEILHTITIRWLAPDWMCQFCKFMDVFGVYLGSNVLMAITVDRFCCIMFPSYVARADSKVNLGLGLGWVLAAVLSLPQMELFYVATHPCYTAYTQCIAVSFLGHAPVSYTLANTFLTMVEVYFLPFLVIILCYGIMFWKFASQKDTDVMTEMVSDSSESGDEEGGRPAAQVPLPKPLALPKPVYLTDSDKLQRRQTQASLNRSRSRNFHMTAAMVILFLICWTPYFIGAAIHFADTDFRTGQPRGTLQVPSIIGVLLSIVANLNSCANPYLYGYFSLKLRKDVRKVVEKMLSNASEASGATQKRSSERTNGLHAPAIAPAQHSHTSHSQHSHTQPSHTNTDTSTVNVSNAHSHV